MKIESKFGNSEIVRLKHDKEKMPRQIVGINIRGENAEVISYQLQQGKDDSWHYEFEIEKVTEENKNIGFK